MSKKRFTREEIIGKLRNADVLLGQNGIVIDPEVRAKPSRKVAADSWCPVVHRHKEVEG